MTPHPLSRPGRFGAATVTALVGLALGGCGFDPASMQLPGSGVAGPTYPLHIQFANVLNLPPGAKVIVNGVEEGTLTGLHIIDATIDRPGYVVADIDLADTVELPGDVTAQLQQATPLGDVRITLDTPPGSPAPPLPHGATITLAHTVPAPQIEDTLAGLATTVGSGAVSDIQNTVRRLNAVLPAQRRDTAHIFGVVGSDVADVAGDLDAADRLLDGLNGDTDVALANMSVLQRMLTPAGVDHLAGSVNAVISVFYIFAAMGPMAHSAQWLAPLVKESNAAAAALVPLLLGTRPLDVNSPSNLKRLVDLIDTKLIPFTERGPKINLITDTAATAAAPPPVDRTDQIIRTLRMIGAVQ